MSNVYRSEYPRPQFVRKSPWVSLNGEWEFEFDDNNVGPREKWYNGHVFSQHILVPFAYECPLSGVDDKGIHNVVWYRRTFTVNDTFRDREIHLHFNASDYMTTVWVNGSHLCDHEGGYTPFSCGITSLLQAGENELVVRVEDQFDALDQPRGKQVWKKDPYSIFFSRTTGIWQSVWLEGVSPLHLRDVKMTPKFDTGEVAFAHNMSLAQDADANIAVEIRFQNEVVVKSRIGIHSETVQHTIALPEWDRNFPERAWSPEHPNLYDVTFRVFAGTELVDEVSSYFGMRKISIENGRICLNNEPYYMKLVLDQGYYPGGVLTPPTVEDIARDVRLTKEMGFNGARKHQKIEDPYYLYLCDKEGLLVWGEMPSCYKYSEAAIRRTHAQWQDVIHRDYNHPCIVVWVPLNESWGVPQLMNDERHRAHSESLYYLTKSLDTTRLVISNDGWELTSTDLCTIHDYAWDEATLRNRYARVETAVHSTPGQKSIFSTGFAYANQPILVTEFGGMPYQEGKTDWEYAYARTQEEFHEMYEHVIRSMLRSPAIQGFCYTELTDVEHELVGLLDSNRIPKLDIEIIRDINNGIFTKTSEENQ